MVLGKISMYFTWHINAPVRDLGSLHIENANREPGYSLRNILVLLRTFRPVF